MMVGYKREELRTNGKEETADYLFPFYLLDKTAKICIGDIIYIRLIIDGHQCDNDFILSQKLLSLRLLCKEFTGIMMYLT